MSSLAEELAADQAVSSCKLCAFIDGRPPEERAEWHAQLSRPANVVSHASVLRALSRRGLSIGESSVKRHRRLHEG